VPLSAGLRYPGTSLTGRLLNPAEGLQEHLVRYVEPATGALNKAKELARRIAQNTIETNLEMIHGLPRIQDPSRDDGLFVEQLNSAMAKPPEAEKRLREFVEGKSKPLVAAPSTRAKTDGVSGFWKAKTGRASRFLTVEPLKESLAI
jgi:hypothetical protein